MSKTTIVAAVLGGVVLLAVWMRSGDEPAPAKRSSIEHVKSLAPSKPMLPERQRPQSPFDRPQGVRDHKEPLPREPETTEETEVVVQTDLGQPRQGKERPPELQARLDAFRERVEERRQLAGVERREQLSRRQADDDDMTKKVEQPPLRAPLQAGDEEEYEDTVEHWRDVALHDPDPDERIGALSELDFDEPGAMDIVVAALDDHDAEVRLAALNELTIQTDEVPTGILARLINDPDPEVRLEVIGILAESEEPHARQLLRGALSDTDEDVRDEARAALDLD